MKALLEVFFQPGKLFATLPQRPGAWVAPLIANTLLVVISTAITINVLGMNLIMRQRLADSHLTPEQMRVALERASSPASAYGSYATVAIGTPLMLLVVAGVLFAFSLMSSRAPEFDSMLAMVNLAFFPYFLITAVMTAVVVIAAQDKSALDTGNLLATNLASLVNRSATSKIAYTLSSSLDFLSFLEILLLSFGFARLTKTRFAAGLGAVLGLWILYVSSKMVITIIQ